MIITSRYDGHCRKCGVGHQAGDKVDWVKNVKGVTCVQCVANSMGGGPGFQPPMAQPFTASPPPRAGTWASQTRSRTAHWRSQPFSGPLPGSPQWQNAFNQAIGQPWAAPPPAPVSSAPLKPAVKATLEGLILQALVALEAVILEAAGKQLTPEMESAWTKYEKLKTLALNPSTKGEERAAMKQALIHAVKLAV